METPAASPVKVTDPKDSDALSSRFLEWTGNFCVADVETEAWRGRAAS